MKQRLQVLVVVVAIIGVFLWQLPLNAQAPPQLFRAVVAFGGDLNATEVSGGIPVKRSRAVQVENSLINSEAAAAALRSRPQAFGPDRPLKERPVLKRLTLNLFEDAAVIAELRSVTTSGDGRTTVWSGTLQGSNQASVTLAITGRSVSGNVTTDSHQLFEIRTSAKYPGTQLILEVDQKSFPKEASPVPVKGPGEMAQDINPHGDDGSVIDVLVAYTPSATEAAGGNDGILNLIQTAEAETNQGYENSGVKQRIRIVSRLAVNVSEAVGFEQLLKQLPNSSDRPLRDIRAARDQFGADMVVLLVRINDPKSHEPVACGLSYLAQHPTASFATKAFSIVHVACATGYYSFGHELGHLQGCNHDRAHATSPGAFFYSYGYQRASAAPRFRDIMAYDCSNSPCDRINYWSSPDIDYQGTPVGEQVTATAGTDNRQTLNNTRAIAARWRA